MVAKIQIKRTETNDLPPTGLLPGELSVEMGVPTRLWVGVPTTLDSTGKKLLAAPATGNYVLKSGDTMTGSLTIAPASAGAQIALNKPASPAGVEANIAGYRGGLTRWAISLASGETESGGNAGSNFAITRYNDAGNFVNAALSINRATGNATFSGAVISGQTANSGVFYFGSDLQHYMSFNGTNYTLQGGVGETFACSPSIQSSGSVIAAGGVVQAAQYVSAGTGYRTKQGVGGAFTGNYFNFDWNGNIIAWMDNVNVGQVAIVSDYRVKQNVNPLPSTWDKVKALNPITYNMKRNDQFMMKEDDVEHWGFIAHELQATLTPDASTGVKDAENVLQSPNALVLIAALTKALQEAMNRIEALEAR